MTSLISMDGNFIEVPIGIRRRPTKPRNPGRWYFHMDAQMWSNQCYNCGIYPANHRVDKNRDCIDCAIYRESLKKYKEDMIVYKLSKRRCC
jgi:hypothetical protein